MTRPATTAHTETRAAESPGPASRAALDQGAQSGPGLLQLIGGTPLVQLHSLLGSGRFFAKLEGNNPAGGMKVRAAHSMLESALNRGDLRPGGHVVESTSGTLGLALAFTARALDLRVTIVADSGLEPLVRNMLRAYGAELILVERPHPSGGWQEARRRAVLDILDDDPAAFWPDQYNNPDNPAGYRSLADELVEQLPALDVLVCSVGTGGHSNGIAQILRRRWPRMRMVGVDSVRSTIFGQPAGTRLMRGLGSSIYPRNVLYPAFDDVHWVAPAESVAAARSLAATQFITGGWSVGAVALVASWYADTTSGVVATVFPDSPERYWATVFDDGYCGDHGLTNDRLPTEPRYVTDPHAEIVDRWSFTHSITDPLTNPDITEPSPTLAPSGH